jgi:hypothetical protein
MPSQALPFRAASVALAALAVQLVSAGRAQAQYDNRDRLDVIKSALRTAAPENNGWGAGLAGIAFDTPATPITLQRYDTPDNRSFGPEAATNFIYGPRAGGLGTPAAAWAMGASCWFPDGRRYGTKTDLRWYASTVAAAPAFAACATNTHLAYNELLRAVRTCGNRCYVDIASLSNINVVRAELRGAIEGWLVGKPDSARLILRVTEGFFFQNGAAISGEVDFFARTVRAGAGRVEVYGLPITSGAPFAGTWSHAKLFGVYDLSNAVHRSMIGGQNHWTDYDGDRPPFDTNTMITGAAATRPSLQLDAAARWFDDGRSWVGRRVAWTGGQVRNTRFKWDTAGYANSGFGRFSGIANVNPRAAGALAANQRALVSLIDMGAYSVGNLGRTIARTLHDLVAAEPRTNHIRVWNQALSRPASVGIDGNYGGRHEQTYVGRLVYRALTAARLGWATNVWALTSHSSIRNSGYASPFAFNVRGSLYDTGEQIACTVFDGYRPGWNALRFFNNPRGNGGCRAAVVRGVNGRFHWRMARAFINGFGPRQQVGLHHKLVMFGSEAMFQGSFNAYPSAAGAFSTFDSKLVENGGIILDPAYTANQVDAFEEAWSTAVPVIGGP